MNIYEIYINNLIIIYRNNSYTISWLFKYNIKIVKGKISH